MTADVSDVSIACSDITFTVGGTVSGLTGGSVVTLKNNGGDALPVAANGAFTFATPMTFGSSYAVTVGTQPAAQTCTVTNGTGSNIAAAVNNVQIACVARVAYVYIPNYGSNNVLGYKFNFATGARTNIPGSPFASGVNDRWVTTNPAGTFAYVANQNDHTVSAYTINRATGALTAVAGSPYATGTTPVAMAVNPAGTFLYVTASNGGSVSGYAIDQTTGALTPVAGSPFAAGSIPTKIAINPAGTYAYVTNQNAGTVTVFSIDSSTGALTEISGSPFSIGGGNQPQGITGESGRHRRLCGQLAGDRGRVQRRRQHRRSYSSRRAARTQPTRPGGDGSLSRSILPVHSPTSVRAMARRCWCSASIKLPVR